MVPPVGNAAALPLQSELQLALDGVMFAASAAGWVIVMVAVAVAPTPSMIVTV